MVVIVVDLKVTEVATARAAMAVDTARGDMEVVDTTRGDMDRVATTREDTANQDLSREAVVDKAGGGRFPDSRHHSLLFPC